MSRTVVGDVFRIEKRMKKKNEKLILWLQNFKEERKKNGREGMKKEKKRGNEMKEDVREGGGDGGVSRWRLSE